MFRCRKELVKVFEKVFWTRWLRVDESRDRRSTGSHLGVLVRCYSDPDKEQ